MMLRWVLAAVHLLALGIGLGAVYVRGRALSGRMDADKVRAALAADAWWGLAALLWVGSGLWRLFGSVEKDTAYYMGNHVFWTKMVLFIGILAMEIRPIITLSRWRRELARGIPPNTSSAARISRLSYGQAVLVVLMVLAATAMARGIGGR
jgi:putative membrane protein